MLGGGWAWEGEARLTSISHVLLDVLMVMEVWLMLGNARVCISSHVAFCIFVR